MFNWFLLIRCQESDGSGGEEEDELGEGEEEEGEDDEEEDEDDDGFSDVYDDDQDDFQGRNNFNALFKIYFRYLYSFLDEYSWKVKSIHQYVYIKSKYKRYVCILRNSNSEPSLKLKRLVILPTWPFHHHRHDRVLSFMAQLHKALYKKTSLNKSNTVLVIQRRERVVTDFKNWQKVCFVHCN